MSKTKKTTNKIFRNYLIALIPAIIYGIYKNGYIVYSKGFTDIFGIFLPLITIISSVIIAYLIELIINFKDKEKIKDSFLPLYSLIIACTISPSINLLIYFPVLTICLIIIKLLQKNKIFTLNSIAFIKIALFIILIISATNSYLNIYESSTSLAIVPIDMIFGRSIGGTFSTSIICILIGYIYLSNTKLYKKEIPIYTIIAYTLPALIYGFIIQDPSEVLMYLLATPMIFAAVFIVPESLSSPYTKKGKIIYGLLIGALGFCATYFINFYDGIYIAILVISLLSKPIDKVFALK